MRTTVDLPEDLFVAAKTRAAELREPLRKLIERSLRKELSQTSGVVESRAPLAWQEVVVEGGLPEGIDLSDRQRMYDWLQRGA